MKSTTSVLVMISAIATLLVACVDIEHRVGGKTSADLFEDPDVQALADAACRGQVEQVSELTSMGVDSNATGLDGINPLIWALTCESHQGMTALLEAGADPNQRMDVPGSPSAVIYAVSYFDSGLLRLLLEAGGDPSALSSSRGGALDDAVSMGLQHDIWDHYYMLLSYGSNPYEVDVVGDQQMSLSLAEILLLHDRYCKVFELFEGGFEPHSSRAEYFNRDPDVSLLQYAQPTAGVGYEGEAHCREPLVLMLEASLTEEQWDEYIRWARTREHPERLVGGIRGRLN